jgi:type II secretory pathway pseudopilin PulG
MFPHIKTGKRLRAETLLEVIVSVFVVALGSAAATSLVVSALQTNALSRDNLIALNLATEGIEAMRNIRDSNWIKYAYDKENCWNMKSDQDSCKDMYLISASNYTLLLDTSTMRWKLGSVGGAGFALNLASGASYNETYRLGFNDLDNTVNSDGQGDLDDDRDIFVPKGTSGVFEDSKFYRMIAVTYPTGDPTVDQYMTVTSVVQWKDRGTVHEIRIASILSNYQKVKK